MTNDPVSVTLLDLLSIFKPVEAHIWSLLDFTCKPDSIANIDLHGDKSFCEHGLPCSGETEQDTDSWKRVLKESDFGLEGDVPEMER